MAAQITGGAQPLPTALLAQAIPMLTRHDLEALTERLIDVLDAMDGDCDTEDDDPSGQCDEDGINTGCGTFMMHGNSYEGPGCWIADGGQ